MKTTESHEPTPAARRAAEKAMNAMARLEYDQWEHKISSIIDAELASERERAREFETVLFKMTTWAETYARQAATATALGPLADDISAARALLAMSETLRADREGSK
jgi:hypothetical protein